MDQTCESVCPACYSKTSKKLWSTSARKAAQHFVRAETDAIRNQNLTAHITKLWGQDTCDVMSCEGCGLGFADPFVAGDAYFYNLAYPGTPGYPLEKWEFSRTIHDLKTKYADRIADCRCLEVGSGVGNFLKKLTQLGVRAENILALEYNTASLKVLQKRGFQGKAADIRALEGESFDFIFMFQVLEHMDDLDRIFAKTSVLLNPGGSMYLAVPNKKAITFNELNGALMDMPPNHISRWTKTAFDAVLKRHGLQMKEFEIEAASVHSVCLQDLKCYTLRQSMYPHTLASKANGAVPMIQRKFALALVAMIYLFKRLPLWLRTAGSFNELGGSTWLKVGR